MLYFNTVKNYSPNFLVIIMTVEQKINITPNGEPQEVFPQREPQSKLSDPDDIFKNDSLSGYSKKYRGNHRSHNRGMGFEAFMRNLWMLRYRQSKR